MLHDEKLEVIQRQFEEKGALLEAYGERVTAWTLYEDLFGTEHMDDVMPVVVLGEEREQHILKMPLSDAVEQSVERNDMLVGSCSYFNEWISKTSIRNVYGFIIDMDNVYSGTLASALENGWGTANGEQLAVPTYIVNSGTGLHLYYVFTEPIPHYRRSADVLDRIYRNLAVQQTTKRVYVQKQVQWMGQCFRFAGGRNKYGWENSAYRVVFGHKWDIDELAAAVGIPGTHVARSLEKQPAQPQKQLGKPRVVYGRKGGTSRKFYEYALRNCREKTHEGHRYTSFCALVTAAWKCGVPLEEVEKDLADLIPVYNKGATDPVKPSEVTSALKMYNDKALLTQRTTLENWQGWEYHPIKRNGRKQAVHLARCRALLELDFENGEWRHVPATKQETVQQWRAAHPEGKKIECHRDTGISFDTIRKWWDT